MVGLISILSVVRFGREMIHQLVVVLNMLAGKKKRKTTELEVVSSFVPRSLRATEQREGGSRFSGTR